MSPRHSQVRVTCIRRDLNAAYKRGLSIHCHTVFVDFADALTNPIAFQSKAEIRGHMLECLMDDDEATSQVSTVVRI